MCLILFAVDPNPDYRLVVAANRDEYHGRPSAALDYWQDHPHLLAGRDLEAGGTWLGITRQGRFAAVTNFREDTPQPLPPASRGEVTVDFLTRSDDPQTVLAELDRRADRYRGFNLLAATVQCGTATRLGYYANRPRLRRMLGPGVYGLSNQLLDCDWPKVNLGREQLRALMTANDEARLEHTLFGILAERTEQDPDDATGESARWSDKFILGETYGTVASTVLLVHGDGRVRISERRFAATGRAEATVSFTFNLP